jgi:hypothetical protein
MSEILSKIDLKELKMERDRETAEPLFLIYLRTFFRLCLSRSDKDHSRDVISYLGLDPLNPYLMGSYRPLYKIFHGLFNFTVNHALLLPVLCQLHSCSSIEEEMPGPLK